MAKTAKKRARRPVRPAKRPGKGSGKVGSVAALRGARNGSAARPEHEFVRGGRLSSRSEHEPDVPPDDFSEVGDPRKRAFLAAFSRLPHYGLAAKAANVSTVTVWKWRTRESDPVFAEAFARAFQLGIEAAEGELWRRGVDGVEVPVYQGGRLVGTKREVDTSALTFALKANYREKYGDRVEQTGPGGGPIQHEHALRVFADLPDEEVDRLYENTRLALEAAKATDAQVVDAGEPTPEQLYEAELARRKAAEGASS